MTDVRHDLTELLVDPGTAAQHPSGVTNPYGAPAEPVRSDPYAALRQDAEAREAKDFGVPTLSSLSSAPRAGEEPGNTESAGPPPEPVLSDAVLVAAGLLEPEAPSGDDPAPAATLSAPVETSAVLPDAVREGTFADLLRDAPAGTGEEDLTQIFAGLDPAEPETGVWRRGDDDLIGAGTPSRSAKRRSLRLRRRAA